MNNNILVAYETYWVGYVDDRKVPFHRLILEKGTTYNSYLLKTEQPTIIDTVDISFGGQFIKNLSQHIDPSEIKYIVINHVEPDHSGGLPVLANKAKDAIIVTTELGAKELKEMYRLHHRQFMIIKDGDTLDIGGKTLQFFETPYLHTEETMITYCIEDKALYPCDIFSSHVATKDLFNDLSSEDMMPDFQVYYQLIMHPHRPYVQDMIKKIRKLDIKLIAPSHGYILREDAKKYIDAYDSMSQPSNEEKRALILYSTMTNNTKKIANHLADGLKDTGLHVESINAKEGIDLQPIKEAIEKADVILFGSSTRYADMVGAIEKILMEIKDMDLSKKWGVAFGSYGWSGEAVEVINDYLKSTNIQVVESSHIIKATGMDDIKIPIRVKFDSNDKIIEELKHVARTIGDLVIA